MSLLCPTGDLGTPDCLFLGEGGRGKKKDSSPNRMDSSSLHGIPSEVSFHSFSVFSLPAHLSEEIPSLQFLNIFLSK